MRKRASYGAGRTFVQDGFDARTGDEREPREPTLAEGRGRGWEGISTSGESEREARSEIDRRPAKWRKGERERPNSASLSSATGLRNTHIVHSSTVYVTVNRERVSLNEVLKLQFYRE